MIHAVNVSITFRSFGIPCSKDASSVEIRRALFKAIKEDLECGGDEDYTTDIDDLKVQFVADDNSYFI